MAPLTSSTFEELSTSSHEALQVNRPTVDCEVSDPQSIAPSRKFFQCSGAQMSRQAGVSI